MNLTVKIFIGALSVNAIKIQTVSDIKETSQVPPEYEATIISIKENLNELLDDMTIAKVADEEAAAAVAAAEEAAKVAAEEAAAVAAEEEAARLAAGNLISFASAEGSYTTYDSSNPENPIQKLEGHDNWAVVWTGNANSMNCQHTSDEGTDAWWIGNFETP